MKKRKRLFAILLALCVTFTMMPLGGGGAAYAAGSYTLTLPSTEVEGEVTRRENIARIDGASYYSNYDGYNSVSVESGKDVELSCYVQSGWIFESWKAEPEGKVEIDNLCDTTFQMLECNLSITSTGRELVPDVAVSQEGVLTCNAEEGHTLQVTVRQNSGGINKPLLHSEKISAEGGKYTYDIKAAMTQHEKAHGALPEDDYQIFLSYYKGDVQQGYIENAEIYHYEGSIKKLTTPQNLRWDGFAGKWDSVENAANYTVGIMESAPGSMIFLKSFTVTNPEFDLLALNDIQLKNGASYSFNVTANPAKGDTEYVQSDSSQYSPYSEEFQLISKIETIEKALDFGSIVEKAATPAEKKLMVLNSGTKTVQLNMPASKNYNIAYTGSLDEQGKITLAPRETAEFTVQPKDGLAAGPYDEKLTISDSDGAEATVTLKFSVAKSGGSSSGGSSGGGGGYVPVQKPTILPGEGFQTTLSADGTKLTITPADGYEIKDVLLNGTSKGSVTELSGLKTGDKVEIKAAKKADPTDPSKPTDPTNPSADKNAKIIKGVEKTTITLKSKLTKNKKILLTWTKSKGYKVDCFEIYRSVKKNSGYGKKAFFATKNGDVSKYLNTKSLKAGKTYYYKLRGVRTIDDKKYYTQWSNKDWRTVQ